MHANATRTILVEPKADLSDAGGLYRAACKAVEWANRNPSAPESARILAEWDCYAESGFHNSGNAQSIIDEYERA